MVAAAVSQQACATRSAVATRQPRRQSVRVAAVQQQGE